MREDDNFLEPAGFIRAEFQEDFQSLGTIWRSIAGRIARQIQIEWSTTDWDLEVEYDFNISEFLDSFVFDKDESPLLICFDEVDRVFDSPIRSEFFASVRSFYNSGAVEPSWKKIRWLLGTSSEPSFFIEDLTQSPFNIGLREELSTFTPEEVAELARRHGLPQDRHSLDKIMDYVGGRPYLVHLLLYQLARNPGTHDQLFDAQTAGGGVFQRHLHPYLSLFQQQPELAKAMADVINGEGCDDVKLAERLEAAGLVRRDEHRNVVPLCQLYIEFFNREMGRE